MAVTDTTVEGATEIDRYDFLKFVNQHFGDLASHYINMFQVYHGMFAQVAFHIVAWGGLAWVAVLAFKAPFDRMLTAAGGIAMVVAGTLLLSPSYFALPGGYSNIQLANGAGYTYQIIGNIYQLFKDGLDSVSDKEAMEIAFDTAYHVTDAETIKRYLDSPMTDMYRDYTQLCQPAFEAVAGKGAETWAAGRYVGLYGSGGIGQQEVQWEKANGIVDSLTGKDPNLDKTVQNSMIGNILSGKAGADNGTIIEQGMQEGVKILQSIPAEKNPFDGKSIPVTGYRIPTKEYWDAQMFKAATGDAPIYHDAADVAGNSYRNTAYVDQAVSNDNIDKTAAYPKNCYDLYKMVDQGERNWQASVKENTRQGRSTAYDRDRRNATMLMYSSFESQLSDRKADSQLSVVAKNAQMGSNDRGSPDLADRLTDSTYTTLADLGAWFKELMLVYIIPMSINGCAMLVGFLITMFPLVCIMAMFISPKILGSFVKLMSFAFLVPFTNDACLSMSATLLSVNGQLLEGYNAGNFTKNNALLISAGSAEYIVFAAIGVIELIFAKILIWDDMKSISSFNPGGAAVGMAATGGAVMGAGIKLASMFATGGKSLLASGAAGKSTQTAQAVTQLTTVATKLMNQQVASGLGSGGQGGGGNRPSPSGATTSQAGKTPINFSALSKPEPSGPKPPPTKS